MTAMTLDVLDPATWRPHDVATLLFDRRGGRALLVRKKRGLGAGKINAPGGRLEPGEAPRDAAVREVREELGVEAFEVEHFYTTDFFQQSAFHSTPMQVVSVYYTFSVADPWGIPVVQEPFAGLAGPGDREVFRWVDLRTARVEDLTLPIDRVVMGMLLARR